MAITDVSEVCSCRSNPPRRFAENLDLAGLSSEYETGGCFAFDFDMTERVRWFRPLPLFFPIALASAVVLLVGSCFILTYEDLMSRNGALLVAAIFVAVPHHILLVRWLWRSHWRLSVNRESLVARHCWTRTEWILPWPQIVSVEEEPALSLWWMGRGHARMRISKILVADGRQLWIGTHFLGYGDLIRDLVAHMSPSAVRQPYRSVWDSDPPSK